MRRAYLRRQITHGPGATLPVDAVMLHLSMPCSFSVRLIEVGGGTDHANVGPLFFLPTCGFSYKEIASMLGVLSGPSCPAYREDGICPSAG